MRDAPLIKSCSRHRSCPHVAATFAAPCWRRPGSCRADVVDNTGSQLGKRYHAVQTGHVRDGHPCPGSACFDPAPLRKRALSKSTRAVPKSAWCEVTVLAVGLCRRPVHFKTSSVQSMMGAICVFGFRVRASWSICPCRIATR